MALYRFAVWIGGEEAFPIERLVRSIDRARQERRP